MTLPFGAVRTLRLLTILVAGAFVAAACGSGGPSEYSEATRAAFMNGCVEAADSSPDLVEVCECTYDTAVEQMPFEQFKAAEQRLQEGSPEVSSEFSEIILACIRQVSASR